MTSLLEDRSCCHFALETGPWREMLISYLQGMWVKRNPVNPIGLGFFPFPPPPTRQLQEGASGTTMQIQACRPSQVSGSKEETQEETSAGALQ